MATNKIPAGFPDISNTGAMNGPNLAAYTGPMTISKAGTVIEGKIIDGSLRVTGENVIIKNCVINYSSWWGIDADGAKNIIIQDCTITGPGYGADSNAGILGSGTFLRNDISKSENGIVLTGGASIVKGNFIHDLQDAVADPHYDGISVQGGQHGVLIEDNTIFARDTSNIFIKNDFGPISDVTVNHNFLGGDPGYNVYVDARASGGPITGVKITNNFLDKGFYGDFSIDKSSPVVSGNTEYDPAIPTPAPTPTPAILPIETGHTSVPATPLPAIPVLTSSAGAAAPTAATVGTGSDSLVLKISQDAFEGDSRYTVLVDGKQVGGTLTAHASHADKQSDTLTVKGNWGVGSHDVAVKFLNDHYEGTAAKDRNLYIEGATYDGQAVANSKLALTSTGTKHFTLQDVTGTEASAPIHNVVGTAGSDWLYGTAGADRIVGGDGNDSLFGGGGADIFGFNSLKETLPGVGHRDLIYDFQHNVDKIDLGKIDAIANKSGDQGFAFLGEGTFSSSKQAGQLKYHYEHTDNGDRTVIEGTTNAVAGVDFQISLVGHVTLTSTDFIL